MEKKKSDKKAELDKSEKVPVRKTAKKVPKASEEKEVKAPAKKTTAKKTTAKKTTTRKTTRKAPTKTATKKSVREVEREQTVEAEKIESREFYRRNRKSDSKRSLRVARAGKKRILKANKRAQAVERLARRKARGQASKGKYRDARKTSRKAIEKSDRIIQKAITKNARLYGKFERKRYIKELVKSTTAEINEEYLKDEDNSIEWSEKNPTSKIAKFINGVGRADISVKRFTAKADMGIASLYARAANFMGFSDHAKMVIEEAAMAAEERVRYSRADNERTRANVDRVFGFAERRKKNLETAEAFIETLSRDVITGISEGWTHLNDDLATWIEEIDQKSRRPMPQRNYNLAFASGGYVSNSFQSRSRNVFNFVEGSLTGNQRGGSYQQHQRNNTLGTYGDGR